MGSQEVKELANRVEQITERDSGALGEAADQRSPGLCKTFGPDE
jgi:hypothetical protein